MSDHFFSVVVPTHNRPQRLASCLDALARQNYARDRYEIIVVNDGGHSPLDDAISVVGARANVRLVHQSNAGPASARNHGARLSSGDYIAFTDDDCEPAPNWLSSFSNAFRAQPHCMVGGRTVNALSRNPYSRVSQDLVTFLYGYYNRDSSGTGFFASNNISVPAQEFRQLGGFDESFPLAAGEDRELCYRWHDAGRSLAFAPEALVVHSHSLNFKGFIRQHYHYGRGAAHLRSVRIRQDCPPLEVEPLSFYSGLLLHPIKSGGGPIWPDVVLMFLTQVANVGGYVAETILANLKSRVTADTPVQNE